MFLSLYKKNSIWQVFIASFRVINLILILSWIFLFRLESWRFWKRKENVSISFYLVWSDRSITSVIATEKVSSKLFPFYYETRRWNGHKVPARQWYVVAGSYPRCSSPQMPLLHLRSCVVPSKSGSRRRNKINYEEVQDFPSLTLPFA